jgi:hypothetical protein
MLPSMSSRQRRRIRCSLGVVLVGATTCLTGEALAHIDLITPAPREHGPSREPNSNVKQGPCGQEENGRTTEVSVFAPGETIEVTWNETTNHRSYYRVAFDRAGDDTFPTFEGPGTSAEGIDPSGPCPVDGQVILAYDMDDRSGGSHTLSVRLPEVECEDCTLQVIQFMYDAQRPYYFQCADLALRAGVRDAGARAAVTIDAGPDAAAAPADTEPEVSAAAGCSSRIAPLAATPMPSDDARPASPTTERPSAASPAPPPSEPAAMTSSAARRSGGMCSFQPLASSPAAPLRMSWLLSLGLLLAQTRRATRPRR